MKTNLQLNKDFFHSLDKIKSKNITYIWRRFYGEIKNFDLTDSQKSILEDWLTFKLDSINNTTWKDWVVNAFYWNKKLRELLTQREDD